MDIIDKIKLLMDLRKTEEIRIYYTNGKMDLLNYHIEILRSEGRPDYMINHRKDLLEKFRQEKLKLEDKEEDLRLAIFQLENTLGLDNSLEWLPEDEKRARELLRSLRSNAVKNEKN